jgi:YD repeat-containing protein
VVQRDAPRPIIGGDFGDTAPMDPPVFAVAVSDSHVLTHAAALAGGRPPTLTNADGVQLPAAVAAFDVTTDMVLLSSPSPAPVIPSFADAIAAPGALVVGAARSNTRDVAIPLFITSVTAHAYGLGGSSNTAPPGLPIYDVDGRLLAVSAGDGTAWRIRYALDRLLAQAATGGLPSAIAVTYQVIDEPLAPAFGATGLAIVDVAPGGPADAAGVHIGDVITAIGPEPAAGGDLTSALAALRPGTPVPMSLRRAGKDLAVTVTPALAHEMVAIESDPSPAAGPPAHTLFPREALAAAAVPATATVIRELRPVKGITILLLEHRGRRFFAAIETPP